MDARDVERAHRDVTATRTNKPSRWGDLITVEGQRDRGTEDVEEYKRLKNVKRNVKKTSRKRPENVQKTFRKRLEHVQNTSRKRLENV